MSWDQLARIRQHGWKERLKISKVAKFESDLLKTYEGIAPQRRVILRDVLYGGGQVRAPTTNVCKISRLCGLISSLSLDLSPLNLVSYLILKFSFRQCRWLFAYCAL